MKQDAQNIMEGRTETLRTMDKQMRQLDSMFRGVSGGDGGGEISPKDLEYTAKKHGISVEEVKRRIASKQRKR
jgi:hypothetical protein